jgi:hypothetical protein
VFYVEVEVEVNLRRTVSRPVCPGVRRPSGTRDQFFFLLEISFRQLRLCYFVTPSLTRGRVCNVLVQLLLDLARAVTLGSKSRRTHSHILLSSETLPIWRARSPYLYPPGTGWPSYTPGYWVVFYVYIYIGGRSVGIVRSRTQTMEFFFCFFCIYIYIYIYIYKAGRWIMLMYHGYQLLDLVHVPTHCTENSFIISLQNFSCIWSRNKLFRTECSWPLIQKLYTVWTFTEHNVSETVRSSSGIKGIGLLFRWARWKELS